MIRIILLIIFFIGIGHAMVAPHVSPHISPHVTPHVTPHIAPVEPHMIAPHEVVEHPVTINENELYRVPVIPPRPIIHTSSQQESETGTSDTSSTLKWILITIIVAVLVIFVISVILDTKNKF